MKSNSSIAFVISLLLYGLLLLGGYWLLTSNLNKAEPLPEKITAVPVTLSMFQAQETPIETAKEPIKEEIAEPVEIVKEVVEEVIEEPIPAVKSLPKIEKKAELKKVPTVVIPKVVPPKVIPPKKVIEPKPVVKPPAPKEKPAVEKVIEKSKPIQSPQPTLPETKAITPQFSNQQVANAEQTYLYELRKKIATLAQDTYPRRAKRRQWEGVVTLSFTLLPSGKIQGLSIKKSSGRQILDDAATSILQDKMNNRFQPFPDEIKRKTWAITLPVSYNIR